MNRFAFCFLSLFVCTIQIFSQEKTNVNFGKVTAQDFIINSPLIDSDTKAVVIADVGSTSFVGNKKGWFSFVYKRQIRIKILNKTVLEPGFDVATIKIILYAKDEGKEVLSDVNAVS